jgi:drug/metabolite transporter (DMT)-like permease
VTEQSTRKGITLMIFAMLVFAIQDGISRHLAAEYNPWMVVMIRYWFFAAFVIAIAMRRAGGIRAAAATKQPLLQVFRGLLLAAEICVALYGFVVIGLVDSHAIFSVYPLLVVALSGPVLGEKVGWRRWSAIGAGFVGMLVILAPGMGAFQTTAIIPVISATMFAVYAILTRFAARKDSTATSFFWTGTAGAVVMTVFGLNTWEPMTGPDWVWMLALCITGVAGHWLLIRCYEIAEASALQPFAYFHLVFAVLIGVVVFKEALETNVAIGALIIVAAGIFALLRARQVEKESVSG